MTERTTSKIVSSASDSLARALGVTLGVALVCGGLASISDVLLEARQSANRLAERQEIIEKIVARMPGVEAVLDPSSVDQIEARVVDLATGNDVSGVDPALFDAAKAAADPATRVEIPREQDIARIGARARFATIYLTRQGRRLRLVILPVHGSGYTSELRGFLALEADRNSIAALAFYQHGETPGLGARLEDPEWLAKWRGKRLYDDTGRYRLQVRRGRGDFDPDAQRYEVDGITGATRTSQAISQLLRYWLGDHGFGPFLKRLRDEEQTS